MTPAEIHRQLAEQFGDAIEAYAEPQAGDARISVKPHSLRDVCEMLRNEPNFAFDYLRLVTAVDRGKCLSSVYHLYSYDHRHSLVISVDVGRDDPRVSSVSDIWPTANWLERESFDMMGVIYEGHPDLKRILLPLDWQGFPLRKDYQFPHEYHGLKHD